VNRRLAYFATAAAFLLQPLVSPGQENLSGIYRDPDGLTSRKVTVSSFPYICTTYLVVKNPSCGAGIAGWECNLQPSQSVNCVGVRLAGQAINFGTYPNFMVGLAEPLPNQVAVTLCEFDFIFQAPGTLYLEKGDIPSGDFGADPVMACMGFDGNSSLVAMTPEHGGNGIPVFSVAQEELPPKIYPKEELAR